MLGAVRHPVLRWLIYGHLWVALAVAAQVWWTSLFLQDGAGARRFALAAFLGAFAGYGITRLSRSAAPEVAAYANLEWYRDHRLLMHVLVALAGGAAFLLLWPLWPSIWRLMLPAVLLTFLYITPFTSARGRSIGLRTVPFLKAVLIAVVWALVVVAIPMRLDTAEHAPFTILAFTCMRVPLVLALAIVFDIRDQATDPPAMRTVPLVLGVNGAKAIALLLLLCSAGFEVLFLRGHGHAIAAWTILVGYAFAAVLTVRARPVRDPIYYALLVDGALIAIPVCGWAGTLW